MKGIESAKAIIVGGALSLNAALFAAEKGEAPMPDNGAPAAAQPDRSPDLKKEWTPARVNQEIGALRSTMEMIDRHFSRPGTNNATAGEWRDERSSFDRLISHIEKGLSESPSTPQLEAYGTSLDAARSGLSLYHSALGAAGTSATPVAEKRVKPGAPPVIGIYNRNEFLGLKNAATLALPLFESRFHQAGKEPNELEKRVLSGIKEIQSAKDPDDLSQRLMPSLMDLGSALREMHSGTSSQPPLRALQDLEKRVASASPATAWLITYNSLLERDKTPRLHPAGRANYERETFNEMIASAEGLTQVRSAARALKTSLESAGPRSIAGPELISSLEAIAAAGSAEQVPSGALENLRRALELQSGRNHINQP
ncbi:MAG: hypothetical protein J5J00_17035 [Deltaproteobacteria bacterium]|nr:hypothetical protein [Deltaproteobacteria bacterium]